MNTGKLNAVRTTSFPGYSKCYIGHLKFLIMDCPTPDRLSEALEYLVKQNVTDIVRVCEPTYDVTPFNNAGILVHDWAFPDGGTPPQQTLSAMIQLCEQRFGTLSLSAKTIQDKSTEPGGPVIAVHCVAGLGRAPLMVGVCLIESGFAPLDAVQFIRSCRRGALNSIQLSFLVDTYKKRSKKPFLRMEKDKFTRIFRFIRTPVST
ncbi:putative prenylated protein tyrosine phosphatase [Gorgonomyces haynaldii]|nr:putative prenylated protein tyrosine phosphatase [Gorgonomyces haynaldii]